MEVLLEEDDRIKLLNTDAVFNIMQRILLRENDIDRNREHFWVIGLENNNRILFIELVSLGSINKTIVEPMEVFSFALQKRAVKIIMVHNHPSGELTPSFADKDITDHMIQVGLIVNTPVLDHLIISEKAFLSFRDIGLMEELGRSLKYVPPYLVEERLRKRFEQDKKAEKIAEKIRVATELKERGMSTGDIAAVTGLTMKQVEKL